MKFNDEYRFLEPQLTVDNLDLYWVKQSILSAIGRSLAEFEGTLLDIGCGQQPYRRLLTSSPTSVTQYIGMDLHGCTYGGPGAPEPDLCWDGKTIPLDDNSTDTVFATEVLEHCLAPAEVLQEIYRVLHPGGRVFLTVPFLWPLHDAPQDFYRYTPFALQHLLRQAGFSHIHIEALGGWDAALAQMIGLWVSRRPISSRRARPIRSFMAHVCLPVVRYLYLRDRRPEPLETNTMITGLSCIAVKGGEKSPPSG